MKGEERTVEEKGVRDVRVQQSQRNYPDSGKGSKKRRVEQSHLQRGIGTETGLFFNAF